MKPNSKNLIWTVIAVAVIAVVLIVARREGIGLRPGEEKPPRPLSQEEILESLTAPAGAEINIDPRVLQSLTAPADARTVIDQRILDSLTPGK